MTRRLEGTVVLITGASSGIGEATARARAAEGAIVALAARRADRIESLARELGGKGQALALTTGDHATASSGFARRAGAVATELTEHLCPEIREQTAAMFADTERLQSEDIAETIAFIVTRPRRMAVNEVLVRPMEQVR